MSTPTMLGPNGLALIKRFEGLRLNSYQDSVGVWTIGYGHTQNVVKGMTISEAEAENFLRSDSASAVNAVRKLVTVPLDQNQFDALVSFVFNLGAGALAGSTLLRKLNAGSYDDAAGEFGKWVHAGGKVLPGLVKRREAERQLFKMG